MNSLVREKVQLSKQLGQIDVRLAQIDAELESRPLDTSMNRIDSVDIAGSYDETVIEKFQVADIWYGSTNIHQYALLIQPNIDVWPVQIDAKSNIYTILPCSPWKEFRMFDLQLTSVYHFKYSKLTQAMIFVEFHHTSVIGFFIRQLDTALVRFK